MATWTPPVTLTPNTNENVNDLNAIITSLQTTINALDDANLAATAAIQESKLAGGLTGLAKGSFSAYRGTASTITSGSVVPFNTEERDVSNWFDITTNVGRFTPQVAGYFSFAWSVQAAATQTADVGWLAALYKNGALHKQGQVGYQRIGGAGIAVNSTGVAEAQTNGTTDFFEIVLLFTTGGTGALFANPATTYFQGHLIGRS
jgi:hypothetical protein